ncbi:Qb-SNARE protein [Novymonas esmeraldas]|uniref:Qb-SNARE protein n=1 Tax=Novymonas esmeraldas TaxID=1808958 RepID=A0AAW0F9C6_9TRYP
MKRSLRALEELQARLTSDAAATAAEQRRAADTAKQERLAKLPPYKQAEYRCLECVAELRETLRDVEELQRVLGRGNDVSSAADASREAADPADGDDEHAALLLRSGGQRSRGGRPTDVAVQEQELARSRQQARRAHQRLQQLRREAARLAATAAGGGGEPTGDTTTSLSALEWQRAAQHVERVSQWYRDVFGIRVVSSLGDPALQLNRPAQAQQPAGSMTHLGRGANAVPPAVTLAAAAAAAATSSAAGRPGARDGSEGRADDAAAAESRVPPMLILRSAREDDEFREFFDAVQSNDALIDAAVDRLGEGVSRLLDNARGVEGELAVQAALLHTTEVHVEARQAELAGMNRRLRRAIREMEDSSVCMYVLCLLVLLLVLGLLLRVAR